MKKALKITALVLVILMAVAFAIPFLFKKQIAELVKKEINSSLAAKVDFSDVSLSLFRHFPKLRNPTFNHLPHERTARSQHAVTE